MLLTQDQRSLCLGLLHLYLPTWQSHATRGVMEVLCAKINGGLICSLKLCATVAESGLRQNTRGEVHVGQAPGWGPFQQKGSISMRQYLRQWLYPVIEHEVKLIMSLNKQNIRQWRVRVLMPI